MNSDSTVLSILRKARERLHAGQSEGIIPAISSLRDQASGRARDLAYCALLETLTLSGATASILLLIAPERRAGAIELFDETIQRMTSRLH